MTAQGTISRPCTIPFWSWANVLSLDAVAIGLFWHLVFTVQFAGRFPALYESAVLGLTIWLVYTADRLFDSMRLDRRRPHTLRHRLHFEFRGRLVGLWIAMVMINGLLIIKYATETQMRWGYAAVAIVLAYVAAVHASSSSSGRVTRWLPKELQAGMVFAFGTSLSAWSIVEASASISLGIATLMAGLLFATNCVVIAAWEREPDGCQGFHSWVTRSPRTARWLPLAMIAHLAGTLVFSVMDLLPTLVVGCLVASDLLLLLLWSMLRKRPLRGGVDAGTLILVCPRSLFADAALVVPPLAWSLTLLVNG